MDHSEETTIILMFLIGINYPDTEALNLGTAPPENQPY